MVDRRGRIDDTDMGALRAANFSDGEIVEIVTHIGANLFTNYFNHIVDTDIDFPVVDTAAVPLAA